MAVNQLKIRLGAADQMIAFSQSVNVLTGAVTTGAGYDMGASMGGLELDYTPTTFQVEIDQSILPIAAFHTKEELTLTFAALTIQMSIISMAFGYASASNNNVTTTLSGTLAACPTPTATVVGTAGSTSYNYSVAAITSNGDGIPVALSSAISTGPTTLNTTSYIAITDAGALTGAVGYRVLRTTGGSTQGLIATVWGNQASGFTLNDTGLTATAYTASVAQPVYPNMDTSSFGGIGTLPYGSFDFSIPKQDGTSNHIRGHLNRVSSYKAIKINFARDKVSELSKVSLLCLADTTKPVGQQAGSIAEEY